MSKEKFYRMSSVMLAEDVIMRYKEIKHLYPQVSMSKLLTQKINEYILPSEEADKKVEELILVSKGAENEKQ